MVELEIDGQAVRVFEGSDDPRRLHDARHRHADALLRRDAAARQRLPRLRRRGRGLARARARLLAQGRGRDEGADRLRARASVPQAGARAARLVGRSLDDAERPRRTSSATTREPERYGPPAPPDPDRDRKRTGHHVEPDGQTAATVYAPVEGRQRALRPRLLEVHPLLQVRRRLRRAVPEHVRDPVAGRGFDARISTEYVAELPGVGLRLLRQLHRGLPDRRADVQERVRPARRRRPGTSTSRP